MRHSTVGAMAVAGWFLLLFRCSGDITATLPGGGGSETVNARVIVKGNTIAVDVHADSIRHFGIGIFCSTYNPFRDSGYSSVVERTDTVAAAWGDSLGAGTYQVMIVDTAGHTGVLFRNLTVPSVNADTVGDSLVRTASLAGVLVPRVPTPLDSFIAFIPGTNYWRRIDAAGRFVFPGIPPGETQVNFAPVSPPKWNVSETKVIVTLAPGAAFDSLVVTINN
jgi:hypothetical protein